MITSDLDMKLLLGEKHSCSSLFISRYIYSSLTSSNKKVIKGKSLGLFFLRIAILINDVSLRKKIRISLYLEKSRNCSFVIEIYKYYKERASSKQVFLQSKRARSNFLASSLRVFLYSNCSAIYIHTRAYRDFPQF